MELWDWLMRAGRPHDVTPTGMLALDVARIEAGLILLDVDYVSAKKALVPSQKYTPYEIGLGRLVHRLVWVNPLKAIDLAQQGGAFAREIANRVCFLDAGRILETAPPAEMFSAPREARTKQFLQRVIDAGRL